MPLTNTGKKVLGKFESEYGSKGRGYFYGKENKSKKFSDAMTKALKGKSQTVDGRNYSYSGRK